jgi:anti-anti-sigma factor
VTSDPLQPSDRGVAVSPSSSQAPYAPPEEVPFRYDVAREGNSASVRTLGELDMAAGPVLSAEMSQLREAGCRHLVLDLSGLSFMDSTGLRFLLGCYAESRQDGFTIALVPGPPAVQRVFELTRTTDRLPFIEP